MNRYKTHFKCPGCGLHIAGHSDTAYHMAGGDACKQTKARLGEFSEIIEQIQQELSDCHTSGQEDFVVRVGQDWTIKPLLKRLGYPWPGKVRIQLMVNGLITLGFGEDYFKNLEVSKQELLDHYNPVKAKK